MYLLSSASEVGKILFGGYRISVLQDEKSSGAECW